MIALWAMALASAAPAEGASPAARRTLVGEGVLVGAGAFGLSASTVAGAGTGVGYADWAPVGALAGAGGGWWLSRRRPWSEGQAMAFTTAQTVVAGNALGWSSVGGLGPGAGWIGLAGLGAGSAAGWQLARADIAAGDVAIARAGMLWGGLAGVATRFVAKGATPDRKADVTTVLVGADLGLVAGLLVAAQPDRPTRDRVVRVQLAGLGGAGAGLAVGLGLHGAGLGNERSPFAGAALGGAEGLGVGVARLGPPVDGGVGVVPTEHGGWTVAWDGRW